MVELNIEDKVFDKAVKEYIGEKGIDYCKKIIEATLQDEVVSHLKTLAVNRVNALVNDYSIISAYREEVKEQTKKLVCDWSGDIKEDIRKMVDEAVKQQLESGRVKSFVFRAVKDEIHQYVETVFRDFHKEVNDDNN